MRRGSVRNLLILSLPALVGIIGTLWLRRRRRRRDTHTDPSGTTDNIPNNMFKEVNKSDEIITPLEVKFEEKSAEIVNSNRIVESDSLLLVNTSVEKIEEIASEEEIKVEIDIPETEETKPGLEEGELPSSSENSLQVKEETKMMKVEQCDLADKLTNLELDRIKINDAHSEGSSDSGKGHSDLAISPLRTPAGGSSLACNLANISSYKFILPEVLVGRLIGRHGSFLHEIRKATQANVFIKVHPDTKKLKVCGIEGPRQDIDIVLAKIRDRFPLHRFPYLTLERVSFPNIHDNLPSLKMENFQLQLIEGVNNDCIISSLISAAHFFLQQPFHPSYGSLAALNQLMNQLYIYNEVPGLDAPVKDAICAAPTSGGGWYRAKIIDVDEKNSTSTVRYLDYGGYATLHSSLLRQIRRDLLRIPFQAVECYLANVVHKDENGWSEEAKLFVESLTLRQILKAQIYDYADDFTPQVYLYASNGRGMVLVNEELVLRGYGVIKSPKE